MLTGELYDQIQRKGQLTLEEARFYASEVVDILAYLREQQVLPGPAARMFSFDELFSIHNGHDYICALSAQLLAGKSASCRSAVSSSNTGSWRPDLLRAVLMQQLSWGQVVHRDLKPENLLLTTDGHLRLSDFGSAKDLAVQVAPPCHDIAAARGKDLHAGRRSSSLVGSADYVSPEVGT